MGVVSEILYLSQFGDKFSNWTVIPIDGKRDYDDVFKFTAAQIEQYDRDNIYGDFLLEKHDTEPSYMSGYVFPKDNSLKNDSPKDNYVIDWNTPISSTNTVDWTNNIIDTTMALGEKLLPKKLDFITKLDWIPSSTSTYLTDDRDNALTDTIIDTVAAISLEVPGLIADIAGNFGKFNESNYPSWEELIENPHMHNTAQYKALNDMIQWPIKGVNSVINSIKNCISESTADQFKYFNPSKFTEIDTCDHTITCYGGVYDRDGHVCPHPYNNGLVRNTEEHYNAGYYQFKYEKCITDSQLYDLNNWL